MTVYEAAMRAHPGENREALEHLRQRARVRLYKATEAAALSGVQILPIPCEIEGLAVSGLVVEDQ